MCPLSATQNHIFGKPDYYRNGRTGHVNVRGHRRPHAHHYLEFRHPDLHRGRAGNTKSTGTGSPHWLEEGPGARRVACSSWSYRQGTASSVMESWCTCLWLFHAYNSFCLQEHQKRIYQVWDQKVRYSNEPLRSVPKFQFFQKWLCCCLHT